MSCAFVGDEESGEPGTGISAGVRHWTDAVLRGELPRPDLAVYVEPTRLDSVTAELETVIRGSAPADIGVEISYPAGRDHPRGGSPAGIPVDHPLVTGLARCVGAVRPDRGRIEGAPFWSEMPFLTERIGIPTVYCAPGDISICHTNYERVPLQEYHDAILAFAAFIATTCGILPD